MVFPDGQKTELKTGAGKIASNFTGELLAIHLTLAAYLNLSPEKQLDGITIFSDSRSALQALSNGLSNLVLDIISLLDRVHGLDKKCILQWIPAHVDLEFNEIADSLAKRARCLDQTAIPTSLADANAYVKSKLLIPSSIKTKYQITELDVDRKTATTITRLRMKHHKNMKISSDGIKHYQKCSICPDVELTPHHIFDCPAVAADMHSLNYPSFDALYSDSAVCIAKVVMKHHNI